MIARRTLLLAACTFPYAFAQTADKSNAIRGRLIQQDGQAYLQAGERQIRVFGDEPTNKILNDARLNGRVFEANGHASGLDAFTINPIETRPMVVVDGANRSRVTYYCDVCSIRTYSPGPCMCCQAETRLDLIDPASNE